MTWSTIPLSEIAYIERDGVDASEIPSGTAYVGLEDIESGGRILRSTAVKNGELASTKFWFDPQHILYGKLRPYLAKIALPEFSGICSTDILPIRPKPGTDRKFLAYYLRQPHMVEMATARAAGVNLPRISPRLLAEFEVPKPPLEEQRRIAAILDKADAIRRKREQCLALADDLLKSAFVHMVGYKHPEYGRWLPHRIEQLAEDRKGAVRTGPFGSALRHGEFVDEGVAVLGIDNAVQNKFAWGERRFITEEKYTELERYRVFPGDVIITIMGTTGRSAVVPSNIPLAITTKHLATISCNQSLVLPEVLSFAIHSDPMLIRQIQMANKGAIMDGLNLGIIRRLEIKLPPLRAQEKFVALLQRVRANAERFASKDGSGRDLFASLSQRAFRGEL